MLTILYRRMSILLPKKISTDKFSLFTIRQTEIPSLTATTATTRAATVAIITPAVAENVEFVHGIYLLSYRRLSINFVKKIGGSARLLSNFIG
jgi:hypothetical protein